MGIPLPVTGVWTGSLISFLLNLSPFHATLALTFGAMISGTIVTALTMGFVGVKDSIGLAEAVVGLVLVAVVVYVVCRVIKRRK